ncbi:MAG TPA: hypothetical protein PK447_07265 [Ignavibacteria bacterium]|nr:hypothetical protein [Ignavibacteria bacterium]
MKILYTLLAAILLLASAGCNDNPVGAGEENTKKGTITIMMYDSTQVSLQFDTLEFHRDINTLIIKDNGEERIFPSLSTKVINFYVR